MLVSEVRKKYLDFMVSKGHKLFISGAIVPENDNTTLFTSAGMQPMLNYILGLETPVASRITDTQKCFRSQDIEEIGDNRHTTFFEMLGNWSFGDYFKREQLEFLVEFLLNSEFGLGLEKSRLYFTCYAGEEKFGVPRDEEAKSLLMENGIAEENIVFQADNWWSRAGVPEKMPDGEPGGPDCEVFFDFDPTHEKQIHEHSQFKANLCSVSCECGRFMEIGNSVFTQYLKKDGKLTELRQKDVDFGGGLSRLTAAVNDDNDIFNLDTFSEAKKILTEISHKKYEASKEISSYFRIILDHLQAATFLIGDGVMPGNKDQYYFTRRLIRRAIVAGHKLDIEENFTAKISEAFIKVYENDSQYLGDNLNKNRDKILEALEKEESKFRKTLQTGLRELAKIIENSEQQVSGEDAFNLLQSFGFPIEMTEELAREKGLTVDIEEFQKLKATHMEMSREASQDKFKL